LAWALIHQAWNAADSGRHSQARALAEEALRHCRELEDGHGAARALVIIGLSYALANDLQTGVPCLQEGLAVARAIDDPWTIAWALRLLAGAAIGRGDYQTARCMHDESMELLRELGDRRHLAATLAHAGWAAHEQGQWADAARHYRESLKLFAELGDRLLSALVVLFVAGLHACQGNPERGLSLASAAEAVFATSGMPVPPIYQALFERWLEPARRAPRSKAAALTLEEAASTILADQP
jgi:tetratricopeptide (TPR) repeat protein